MSIGIGTLKELILNRPSAPGVYLQNLLELTTHEKEEVRETVMFIIEETQTWIILLIPNFRTYHMILSLLNILLNLSRVLRNHFTKVINISLFLTVLNETRNHLFTCCSIKVRKQAILVAKALYTKESLRSLIEVSLLYNYSKRPDYKYFRQTQIIFNDNTISM